MASDNTDRETTQRQRQSYPTSWEQYQRGEWPYDVIPKNPETDPDAIQRTGLHEFAFEAEDGELYAGCYPRAMINNAAYSDQSELMLGVDNHENAVAIWYRELFRHIFAGGQTGTGKSTGAQNGCLQVSIQGSGLCFIDPGGVDAIELVRRLPDYRLDDVIYMEPGNEFRSHSIGLNYLDTLHKPGDPGYKQECESIATNLLPMLEADEYPRMSRVAKNMLRYLIKEDYEDSEYNYTLIDLYYMLAGDERREKYADMVEQSKLEFLKPFAHEIAEMAGDDLEPLIRRLQSWVESDVVRPFIAQRDSDFSIAEAIANNRIIIVRCNVGKKARRMITAAVASKIWSAVNARPGKTEREMMQLEGIEPPQLANTDDPTADHDPFFLVVDEFHAVVSENMDIGDMLAMARKKRLGLYILTQQLSQLTPEQRKQILGNCSTFLSFDPGRDPNERRALTQGFRGVEEEDLSVGRFTFWSTFTDNEGNDTEPFKTNSIPPYPPLRGKDVANEVINRSQRRYGSKRLTDQEIIEQIPSAFAPTSSADTDTALDGGAGELDMNTERHRNRALKAVYDTSVRQGTPGGWLFVADCVDRLQRYLPGGEITDAGKAWRKVLQKVPDSQLDHREVDGEMQVRAVDKSFMNVGDSENDGKAEHWAPMKDSYVPLMQLGFVADIPEQTGDAMPDGLAKLDDVLDLDGVTDPEAIADRVTTYREEHPVLDRLAGAKDAYIESECTTGDSQPSQTVKNLVQAHNEGHRCLFVARERVAKRVYSTVAHDPPCCHTTHSEDGERRFYTGTKRLNIDGQEMTRPGSRENVWVHDAQTGQYILRDDDGTEHARFDTAAEIFDDASKYPSGGDRNIMPPVIPEFELNGDAIEDVEWDIIVVPESERDEDGNEELLTPLDLQIYREGVPNISLLNLVDEETEEPPATSSTDNESRTTGAAAENEQNDSTDAVHRKQTSRDTSVNARTATDIEETDDDSDEDSGVSSEEIADRITNLLR